MSPSHAKLFLMGGACRVSAAAFLLLGCSGHASSNLALAFNASSRGTGASSCESPKRRDAASEAKKCRRTWATSADRHYAKYETIPHPKVMHCTIPKPSSASRDRRRKNVLVIGDIHGCISELKRLVSTAVQQNDNMEFHCVICVGDLCNKGPQSAGVIRYVREMCWYAVRGNHDNTALSAMLGDARRREKDSYQWVLQGEVSGEVSDEDIMWLSELPYSITIPPFLFWDEDDDEEGVDTIVVHAGFVPGIPKEHQTIEAMVTLREVIPMYSPSGVSYTPYKPRDRAIRSAAGGGDIIEVQGKPTPWASVWSGPPRVIFGHDAKRGYQRYEEKGDWAIGLDTGVCYGKRLTGIILPQRKLVSVDSEEAYEPIKKV